MKDLGKAHSKAHLKRLFPYLEKEYRMITEKETKSKEVFLELFPNEEIDLEKLSRIYYVQN